MITLHTRIDEIKHSTKISTTDDLVRQFPDQFDKIGNFPGEYHIVLDPDVQPVVHAPRRCPIHVRDELKQEFDSMEGSGVIAKVDEPTAWVSSIAISRKAKGKLRVTSMEIVTDIESGDEVSESSDLFTRYRSFVGFTSLKIRFPRFYGNSYLSMPAPAYKLYQSFFITISFKPESLNGRLLFASQEEDGKGDYIAIGLVNGKAVFRFDCGQGAAVITSENSVSLYKWHTLKIGRDNRKGWLQLDDAQIVRGSTPVTFSSIVLSRWGDPLCWSYNVSAEMDGLRAKHMFEGFRGCIESIDIANMDLDLRPQPKGSMVGGQNVGECSEGVCKHHVCTNGGSCISRSPDQAMCLCPLGTHGSVCEDVIEIHTPSFNSSHSSHIAHDTLGKKHLSFLQMEIIFKPKEPSGILIYSGTESREGDFFSITLDENYIGFKFDCGSGPAVLRSTQPVTLHEWHIVEVSRTAREGMLRVDNQPTVTALAPGAFTQTSFDTNLYIGGIDDIDLLSREVAVKNSFSGDIQRVLVNDNQLDLISEAVGGANVGNAHHPCQGQPCLNNGECHPLHENYLCDCRLGFKGDNCEIDIASLAFGFAVS
nr:pikachurin-like [Lytechinus pictus]